MQWEKIECSLTLLMYGCSGAQVFEPSWKHHKSPVGTWMRRDPVVSYCAAEISRQYCLPE